MAKNEKYDLICNDKFKVLKATEDIYDEVFEFFKEHYLKKENVSIVCELGSTELSLKEIKPVVRTVLEYGISYVVRTTETNELVAICLNSILAPRKRTAILGYTFQSPGVIRAIELSYEIQSKFELFEEWKIDCALEINFLATRKDYEGNGLATFLCERSVEVARKILNGTFEHSLPAHVKNLKPQAVCTILTSLYSQKVGEKLGMTTLAIIPFTEFYYKGKSFAEKIDSIHKYATFVALRI